MSEVAIWIKCSICGRGIPFGNEYYVCSVAGCNKKIRTFRFCTPDCWDAHVAEKNHRSAECVVEEAPTGR